MGASAAVQLYQRVPGGRSKRVMSPDEAVPPMAPVGLPPVAVTIEEGVATVLLEAHTRELSEEAKAALLAAERVRIFIDARTGAKFSRPVSGPVKATDYPPDTLALLVQHADLICALVVDCPEDARPDEIEKIFAAFDSE